MVVVLVGTPQGLAAVADFDPSVAPCCSSTRTSPSCAGSSRARPPPPPAASPARPPQPAAPGPPVGPPGPPFSSFPPPVVPAILNHNIRIQCYLEMNETKNKTEITWSFAIAWSEAVVRRRISGLALDARIWDSVGVLAVSSVLSPMAYLPCTRPPPNLMMISPSSGAVAGSQSGPYFSLPI